LHAEDATLGNSLDGAALTVAVALEHHQFTADHDFAVEILGGIAPARLPHALARRERRSTSVPMPGSCAMRLTSSVGIGAHMRYERFEIALDGDLDHGDGAARFASR
jgi:hypothetical protein